MNPPRRCRSAWLENLAYQHTGAEAAASNSQRRRAGSRGAHAAPTTATTVAGAPAAAAGLRQNNFATSNSNQSSHYPQHQHQYQQHAYSLSSASSSHLGTVAFREEDESDLDLRPNGGGGGIMSLDRTPSPQPSGGWASPGLTTTSNPYESNHHRIPFPSSNSFDGASSSSSASNSAAAAGKPISWANAKASSARVNGFASYSKPRSHQKNEGFFGRHMRQISQSLPVFMHGGGPEGERYELKEKPLRSRFSLRNFSWRNVRNMSWQDWRAEVQGLPARVPKSYVSTFKRNRGILGFLFVLLSLLLWFQSGRSLSLFLSTGFNTCFKMAVLVY